MPESKAWVANPMTMAVNIIACGYGSAYEEYLSWPVIGVCEPGKAAIITKVLIVAVSITSNENSELKIDFEFNKPKQPIINKITHGINKIVFDDKSWNIPILKSIKYCRSTFLIVIIFLKTKSLS